MKILQIEIQNYRQYKGKQTIQFTVDNKRNFTVLQGVNGAGKTNLLNAITWCLYGKEEHLAKYNKKMGIINETELLDKDNNSEVECYVKLTLGEESPEYKIERSIKARRSSDGDINYGDEEFEVYYKLENDFKDSKSPSATINWLIPEAVKDFFFFDGERLDDFFKSGSGEVVKKAIFDVSQIELLENAINHLEKRKDIIIKDSKHMSPETQIIASQMEAIKSGKESSLKGIAENENQRKKAQENLDEIEAKLRDSPVVLIQELQKQRDVLKRELDRLNEDIADHKEKGLNNLIKVLPVVYANAAISDTLKKISEKHKKGEIPPKIRDTFVKELLEGGKCICGTDISTDSSCRHNVEKLLRMTTSSKIGEQVQDGKHILINMFKKIKVFIEESESYGRELKRLQGLRSEKDTQLKQIDARVSGVNIDEIQSLENLRIELTNTLINVGSEISMSKSKVANADARLKQLESDLKKEMQKEDKHKVLLKKINFCDESLKTLIKIKQELIDEIRNKIEQKTKEYFLNLIWKKDAYVEVKINEDYVVSVLSRHSTESLGSLSAGERQVLALSFMAALNDISGFNAPVVIDTPLGRISHEPKDNIARCLPDYLKNTQVTLLVTDEEYSPSVRKNLMKRVGKEYKLEFNESKGETKVVPYESK